MPGVLVIEALAQCGAILALREIEDRDQKLVLFTGIKEARFRRPVVPGDSLVLEVTALRFGPRIQRMRGEAKVDGQLCADAELMSVVADRSQSRNDERAASIENSSAHIHSSAVIQSRARQRRRLSDWTILCHRRRRRPWQRRRY
jgi:3-hydroxyacyl-[acyl-carrier-protein] dehydratase